MSDLDALMNEDPLKLSDQDLDKLIRYYRKQRGEHEEGKKITKEGPEKKVDMVALGLKKALPTIKRRI
jgi:hypothetical protein